MIREFIVVVKRLQQNSCMIMIQSRLVETSRALKPRQFQGLKAVLHLSMEVLARPCFNVPNLFARYDMENMILLNSCSLLRRDVMEPTSSMLWARRFGCFGYPLQGRRMLRT